MDKEYARRIGTLIGEAMGLADLTELQLIKGGVRLDYDLPEDHPISLDVYLTDPLYRYEGWVEITPKGGDLEEALKVFIAAAKGENRFEPQIQKEIEGRLNRIEHLKKEIGKQQKEIDAANARLNAIAKKEG